MTAIDLAQRKITAMADETPADVLWKVFDQFCAKDLMDKPLPLFENDQSQLVLLGGWVLLHNGMEYAMNTKIKSTEGWPDG